MGLTQVIPKECCMLCSAINLNIDNNNTVEDSCMNPEAPFEAQNYSTDYYHVVCPHFTEDGDDASWDLKSVKLTLEITTVKEGFFVTVFNGEDKLIDGTYGKIIVGDNDQGWILTTFTPEGKIAGSYEQSGNYRVFEYRGDDIYYAFDSELGEMPDTISWKENCRDA